MTELRIDTSAMRNGVAYNIGMAKEANSIRKVVFFAILAIVTITVTPILYNAKYLMVIWFFFFLLTFKNFKKANKRLRQIWLLGALFVILCTVYWALGISSASLAYCMPQPFVFFAPVIALIVIDQCENGKQIRLLFHLISLFIAINIADSIWITHSLGLENVVYQNLAETLGEEGIVGVNLGGSLYVNMIIFFANVMFMAFLNTINRKEKYLFFVYFLISSYFIIICSLKASAIFLLLISVLLQFVAKKGEKSFGKIILLSGFFVLIVFLLRDTLIDLLIDIIGSDRIAMRLEVFATGSTVADSSTFMSRESLWQASLNTWLRDPITFFFGIGDHDWTQFSTTADSGIGDHSDLLDVLARYGLVGGFVLYSSLFIFYKYLHDKFGEHYKWAIISFFILVILMGLTKKFVSGEPAIVLFILFPLCLKFIASRSVTYKYE